MTDVVVTVPKDRWEEWIAEGDLPGDQWGFGDAGAYGFYDFYVGGPMPDIKPGERVYIVAHGRLRGYAPLVRKGPRSLVRQGNAVAVTIDQPIQGFRGVRYRWWHRDDERPFQEWRTEGVIR